MIRKERKIVTNPAKVDVRPLLFLLFVSTGLFKISQFDLNDLKETFVRDESYSMKCLLFSPIVIDQHFEMSDEWKQCLMKMISWAVI